MRRVLLFSEPGARWGFRLRSKSCEFSPHPSSRNRSRLRIFEQAKRWCAETTSSVQWRRGGACDRFEDWECAITGGYHGGAKTLSFVRERRPDLVHAHSSKAGALARLCRLLPSFPPILYTPHAYYGMPRLGGAKEHFYNFLETLLGQAGITHNCSEDERDFARDVLGLDPETLFVVHHGIDTGLYSPATRAEKDKAPRIPRHTC